MDSVFPALPKTRPLPKSTHSYLKYKTANQNNKKKIYIQNNISKKIKSDKDLKQNQ